MKRLIALSICIVLALIFCSRLHAQAKDTTINVAAKATWNVDTARVLISYADESHHVMTDSALQVVAGYIFQGKYIKEPQVHFYQLNGDPFDKKQIIFGVVQGMKP